LTGEKGLAQFSKNPQKKRGPVIYYNYQNTILIVHLAVVHYVGLSTQCTNISNYKTQNT